MLKPLPIQALYIFNIIDAYGNKRSKYPVRVAL
ncbi:hypothetical protein A2U01_0092610, partial [Trifolium medium]|nr:hypothetical protein [Trifolium medium]